MTIPAGVGELVTARRDKLIRTLLDFRDNELDEYVPQPLLDDMKRLIMSEVHDYTDIVLEFLDALPEGITWNELALGPKAAGWAGAVGRRG